MRAGLILSFTLGATLLATLTALATFAVTRQYLLDQREQTALRQAFADASSVRDSLRTTGLPVGEALAALSPPDGSEVLVHQEGRWYSTSLEVGALDVPDGLRQAVDSGDAASSWADTGAEPVLVVGVPLPAVQAQYYEITTTTELERTLRTVRTALAAFAVSTAAGGALLGVWAAGRAVAPLNAVARTAVRIAGGEPGTRLPLTQDPDLATIVGSFNTMVDALEEQIQREARFSADVSHELRSPLTTLTTSVALLQKRRAELSPRSQQVLDLVDAELRRFARTLDDLLELSRLESGTDSSDRAPIDVADLVRRALTGSARRSVPVLAEQQGWVHGNAQQLERALVNLFDNADRHGRGLVGVQVDADDAVVRVLVDDAGPGVPPAQRRQVFERFARVGSRGSLPGTGLGLSLVAETVHGHGGAVRCTTSPAGGARFVVQLPALAAPPAGTARVSSPADDAAGERSNPTSTGPRRTSRGPA